MDYENYIDRQHQGTKLLQILHHHLIQRNILQKYEFFVPPNKRTADPSIFNNQNIF